MSITKSTALELAGRNDGYLVIAGNPDVEALMASGLVYTRPAGDGYVIARLTVFARKPYHYRGTFQRAADIGMAP